MGAEMVKKKRPRIHGDRYVLDGECPTSIRKGR